VTGSIDPPPATLAETHLSVVVCVGDRAYKLKKPVTFEFVDQSTKEARQALCEKEVARNRRIAPDVYEGVADVVGPDGVVCDHLVIMARMPDDRRLSTLVAVGSPDLEAGLEELAGLVANFHRGAARSPEIDTAGDEGVLRSRWEANAREMRPFDGVELPEGLLDSTLDRALVFLEGRAPLLEQRRVDGRIVDGHGDLLAADIFLLPDGPRVLDCIDFDERLAHGDVASDVAFLAMDLEHLGGSALARTWVSAYEEAAAAPFPPSLLDLYIAHRAQVRAKVTALRSRQRRGAGAFDPAPGQLLALCDEHLRRATVRLVLVGGAPGTGKSTVAEVIGDRPGWHILRSDAVRKALHGVAPSADAGAGWRLGVYTPTSTELTYAALAEEATSALRNGDCVVLDASFTSASHRAMARRVARDCSAEILELRCTLDPGTRDRRIGRRRQLGADPSDADATIAALVAGAADEWREAIAVPTDAEPSAVAAQVQALVEGWIAGART
jgi:aminoglycoside phosphotransferase family enzyme/predicted kinase